MKINRIAHKANCPLKPVDTCQSYCKRTRPSCTTMYMVEFHVTLAGSVNVRDYDHCQSIEL